MCSETLGRQVVTAAVSVIPFMPLSVVVSVRHRPPFLLPVTSRVFSTVELVISKAGFSLGTVLYQDCRFPYSW